MHRFYMFHSFSKFHRNLMAPCCLFLACKVEEQPRKLEYLLKVGWNCMNKEGLDAKSEVSWADMLMWVEIMGLVHFSHYVLGAIAIESFDSF